MRVGEYSRSRRLGSEILGTALLVAAVVGSGIMGERLAGGNAAVALLANSLATGAALLALIPSFGPISGAHFNPLVTAALALRKRFAWGDWAPYASAQVAGGLVGVLVTGLMFGLDPQPSQQARGGVGLWIGEVVATMGLVLVVFRCPNRPWAVPAYIVAAYWFTSSTSFANPAVTLARCFTDTFSGIRPADAPAFVVAQIIGAALGAGFVDPEDA